jgi:acyl-CoA thioesterase-1
MQKFRLSEPWLKRIILSLLLIFITNLGIAHSAPKTVLVLGDSLSAEYGIARGTGWVALLEQRIKENKLDVRVVNASISGDTTSGGLNRFTKLVEDQKPAIVIVELGANDGLRGLPIPSAEKNILSIIAKSKSAKAKVILIGMRIPPNYGPAYTEQFADMYKQIASETKVALVPFLLEGVAEKSDNFQPDQLHPLAAAHSQILNNVWPYLLPLLSK